jgi:hypothetical protein
MPVDSRVVREIGVTDSTCFRGRKEYEGLKLAQVRHECEIWNEGTSDA